MKKHYWLALSTIVVAPAIISVIACDKDEQKDPFGETKRSSDDIFNDLLTWTKSAVLSINSSDAKITANLTLENVKNSWNKPEGEGIRLAAITRAIGEGIWKIDGHALNASDNVIFAIVDGVNTVVGTKNGNSKLNEFKVYLIQNIKKSLDKYHALMSPQKFDGFLNWLESSTNRYANLKSVLMGGRIDDVFIYGTQEWLNKSGGGAQISLVDRPSSLPPLAPSNDGTPTNQP